MNLQNIDYQYIVKLKMVLSAILGMKFLFNMY